MKERLFIPSNKAEDETESKDAATYDLLYITRAYNEKEISFDEWIRQSREWALKIIEQYGDKKGKAT